MWNRFCLILETIMKQIITILSILILILPCSCARTIYVPAETVRTERQEADTAKFMALINSLKEKISQRESVKESLIHKEKETVTLNEKGDLFKIKDVVCEPLRYIYAKIGKDYKQYGGEFKYKHL